MDTNPAIAESAQQFAAHSAFLQKLRFAAVCDAGDSGNRMQTLLEERYREILLATEKANAQITSR